MILADKVALQHCLQLEQYICNAIAQHGGKISFMQFMQHALYAPGLGYYNAGSIKFGRHGDFITAPEIGCLFAKCMTVQIQEILQACNANTILEIGAGSGQFAVDALRALHTQHIKIEKYYILELSADLRDRQQQKIFNTAAEFRNVVQWIDQLPATPFNGVIFANEVLDAMPVALFHYANNVLHEYYVRFQDEKFALCLEPASAALAATFTKQQIAQFISQPYISEINLYLQPWIKSLSACLNRGAILLCDYGFPRAEYYHPQRNQGTLMCHYQHRCHGDPLINIGLQDITAHVDFTAIAEAADACGLDLGGYTNLNSFLLNCDLSKFADTPSAQQSQEINILSSPSEMGELFKCMALVKNLDMQLQGFRQFDKSYVL